MALSCAVQPHNPSLGWVNGGDCDEIAPCASEGVVEMLKNRARSPAKLSEPAIVHVVAKGLSTWRVVFVYVCVLAFYLTITMCSTPMRNMFCTPKRIVACLGFCTVQGGATVCSALQAPRKAFHLRIIQRTIFPLVASRVINPIMSFNNSPKTKNSVQFCHV